jgi:hypothetical protein
MFFVRLLGTHKIIAGGFLILKDHFHSLQECLIIIYEQKGDIICMTSPEKNKPE